MDSRSVDLLRSAVEGRVSLYTNMNAENRMGDPGPGYWRRGLAEQADMVVRELRIILRMIESADNKGGRENDTGGI